MLAKYRLAGGPARVCAPPLHRTMEDAMIGREAETEKGVVYALPAPIDNFEWLGWRRPTAEAQEVVDWAMGRIKQHRLWEPEGDDQAWVMPLPSLDEEPAERRWAVAHKISNNGTTFVWSPAPLPWLEEWT